MSSLFVVVGQNYWAKGPTLAQAKANWKALGNRRLTDGYTVVEFDDTKQEFDGVDGVYGSVQFHYLTEPHVEPVVTEHHPKKG